MRHSGQFKPGDPRRGKGGKRPGAGRPTKEASEAKEAMLKAAFDLLKSSAGKAVSTLVKHLDSKQPNISLRAAERIIEFAHKSVELEELERRLTALEKLTQQGGHYR